MLLDERRKPPKEPRAVARRDTLQAGNAALAPGTGASASSTPACSSSAIGCSVAGLRTVSVKSAFYRRDRFMRQKP